MDNKDMNAYNEQSTKHKRKKKDRDCCLDGCDCCDCDCGDACCCHCDCDFCSCLECDCCECI